jgi:hypothetical protein
MVYAIVRKPNKNVVGNINAIYHTVFNGYSTAQRNCDDLNEKKIDLKDSEVWDVIELFND